MKLPFRKLHPDARLEKTHATDAGFDMTATSKKYDGNTLRFGTGIAVCIPVGYVGLCFMRSSVRDTCHSLANAVGVIDAGYTGEITFCFRVLGLGTQYNLGDKIGQLVIVPIPKIELDECAELPATERGANGYGSTGK